MQLLRATILAALANMTLDETVEPANTLAPTTNNIQEEINNSRRFVISASDYRVYQTSICAWGIKDTLENTNVPSLREISVNQPFCKVMINDYIIFVIGTLKDTSAIQNAVGINKNTQGRNKRIHVLRAISAASAQEPIKLHQLVNTGFFGSELIAYSYDGIISIADEGSTVDSDTVIDTFKKILELAVTYKPRQSCIVYLGDKSNKLVSQLIDTVNTTVPVFLDLKPALNYAKAKYFADNFPQLQLDANSCPVGEQSRLTDISLKAFECMARELPIHGLSSSSNDYGVRISEKNTNRWFMINLSAFRNNGTQAKFTMTFKENALVVHADAENRDIICPIGISPRDKVINNDSTIIEFPDNKFVDSGSYGLRIKHDIAPLGLMTNGIVVEFRKKDEKVFNDVGMFVLYGQLRTIKICGFSPADNRNGVKAAQTDISEIKSLYVNTGLRYKHN